MAYESSQSNGQIQAVASAYTTATEIWIQAASATYPTAHSNTGSLTL